MSERADGQAIATPNCVCGTEQQFLNRHAVWLAPLLDGRGEGVESQMAPVSKIREGLRGLGRQLCGASWQSWLAELAVLG